MDEKKSLKIDIAKLSQEKLTALIEGFEEMINPDEPLIIEGINIKNLINTLKAQKEKNQLDSTITNIENQNSAKTPKKKL